MTTNVLKYLDIRETNRANQAREAETYRHNLQSEQDQRNYWNAQVAETNRHNVASEQISLLATTETIRSDKANEDIKRVSNFNTSVANAIEANRNAETARHNLESELLTSQSNANDAIKAHASNLQALAAKQQAETSRTQAKAHGLYESGMLLVEQEKVQTQAISNVMKNSTSTLNTLLRGASTLLFPSSKQYINY